MISLAYEIVKGTFELEKGCDEVYMYIYVCICIYVHL